jgi:hypothetical protein
MDDSQPERGCSTATAHMLARNEDIQVLLLAWLTVKVRALLGGWPGVASTSGPS